MIAFKIAVDIWMWNQVKMILDIFSPFKIVSIF